MVSSDISEQYLKLVHARKECHICAGLTNPASCADGIYDSEDIGPWSRWHGKLNPELMVVGQDWGDTSAYQKQKGEELPSSATNRLLTDLVAAVGLGMDSVFLTNAILCLKEGGSQAPVSDVWFQNCGERFLKPTIEMINPRVLVSLGERAYWSVAAIFGLAVLKFQEAVSVPEGFKLPNGTPFFPMYHCSRRILNTHRPLDKQKEDWLRMRRVLRQRT